jgi:UDP-GlcNAc:undecaprenyl-phosphate/decaprenyl-phosphate GlcNAc-1-phosphate transferase
MSAAIAFVLSVALMPLAVRLGRITGLVDRPLPGGLKIHATPVSVLGGPAAIVAVLVGFGIEDGLAPGLIVGVGLAVTIGLVDDVRSLPPWPRVVSTGLAGGIAAIGALNSGGVLPVVTGLILGMACANAVNIVDGQDGLAGGLALIASVSMAAGAFALDLPSAVVTLGLATAGGLLGFLIWNRPPARLFLGNGGAYGVGTLLAVQAVVLLTSGVRGFIAAGLSLALFAFELVLTTARRRMVRTSLVEGDRLHSYDLLAAWLGSRARATIVLWLIGAACGGAGFAAAVLPLAAGAIIAGSGIAVAITMGFILLRPKTSPRRPQSPQPVAPTDEEVE